MKKYSILFYLILLSTSFVNAQAPNSVNINTIAIPPVNPVISQYLTSGNVSVTATYNTPAGSAPPVNVFIEGNIQCLSPTPFTITVIPNFVRAPLVNLAPMVPVQLTPAQLSAAFGSFLDNNLAVTGVSLASLKDASNNIKLPPGVYRICFVAMAQNPASGLPGNVVSNVDLGCGNFTIVNTQPANGVTVNTIVIPPLNSVLQRAIPGGSIRPTLTFTGGGNPVQVRVYGKVECLAPTPFTITTNPNYTGQLPVNLSPGAPVTLNTDQVIQALGNLNDNNLTVSGISPSALKDINNNIKLPDGTYRICFYANYVDPAGGPGSPASDANLGCATFNLCGTASAPQFTQPISNLNINGAMPIVQPASPVPFTWLPPNSTCGASMSVVNYELEIHQLLPSQTITDAINNPPVFIKRQLPSSTFLLDTVLYKNILQQGGQYVIRVRAYTTGSSPVQIENNGYSRIQAFQYGTGNPPSYINDTVSVNKNPADTSGKNTGNPSVPPVNLNNDNNNNNQNNNNNNNKPVEVTTQPDSVANCGLKAPDDSTSLNPGTDLKGIDLTVGQFTLKTTTITQDSKDSTYSGSGTISWTLFSQNIKISVAFSKIKVNKSHAVFKGLVTATKDPNSPNGSFSSFSDFAKMTSGQLDGLAGGMDQYLNSNSGQHSSKSDGNALSMPVGLDNQDMGGTNVTAAIMSMSFSAKGATMTTLLNIAIPDADGWLSLAGNFCINPTGLDSKNGTLFLPIDHYYEIKSDTSKIRVAFKGCPQADSTGGTYVTWANGKFAAVVVHASMSFPKSMIVKEDNNGDATTDSVTATLGFNFTSWDDWYASISMDNFQIPDAKGWGFHPSTIFYDHSTKRNVPNFKFPKDYTGFSGNDFEGLYIKDLEVVLPPDFKTFNQGKQRTSFAAQDFVIDKNGISVNILGLNTINLTSGNLGEWAFSLDTVKVVFAQNTFREGRLVGGIELPVGKDTLAYHADLHTAGEKNDSLQFEFVIEPKDTLTFDLWGAAKVELDKNSKFIVSTDKGGTKLLFTLNGDIGLTLGSGSPGGVIPGLKFQNMGIGNYDTTAKKYQFYFNKGDWSFGGGGDDKSKDKNANAFNYPDFQNGLLAGGPNYSPGITPVAYSQSPSGTGDNDQANVGGFPISINNVEPLIDLSDQSNIKIGVKFDLNVNLGFGDASVVSATTKIAIYGKINAALQNMAPQITLSGGFDIDSVALKGGVGPVTVDGMLVFYNHDNTYGNGLKGHVEATFPMVTVEATAQFGNVNNYNYWYIDASATFPTIPVVGPIGINGFGGGAYYNMKMDGNLPADPSNLKAVSNANDATAGHTMSGVTFTPEQGTMGLRATVCVAMVSGAGADAMNAKVTLTAQIKNGAFDLLNLHGDVFVMTNFPSNTNATVNGTVDITYDFPQNKFSLNADVQGKFAMVTADIPLGIYAGPDGWYFKVGDAFAKRASITLVDDSTDTYILKLGATAYFEMGSLINPQLPDLPSQITSHGLTRNGQENSLISTLNQSPGEGMMFGAEVDGQLKFNFAMMYANANAIVGFDMILKHMDQSFQCNSQAAGWQNWYALGQIYAYLGVDVGIHVDVWFFTGDLSLCSLQVAALMTGGMPNPTWLDGDLQVDGEVLNGLVSVHTQAHFTVGDKCYPDADPLKDISIISDYGPKGQGDVFDDPFVVSNVGLETNYNIDVPPTNDKPNGETRTYRFSIQSFTISAQGQPDLQAHIEYQNGNTIADFSHKDILSPNTTYNVTVVCSAMQYYPNEDKWYFPYNDKDKQREQVQQTTTFSFKTGPAPDYVPEKNVHFSYPINHQRYVLKQEMGGQGKLQLAKMQTNLFPDKGGSILSLRKYNLYFIDKAANDTVATTYTADLNSNSLNYTLPANLKNNTVYRMDFYSLPGNLMAPVKINSFVSMSTRTSGNVNYSVMQRKVSGNISQGPKAAQPVYMMYMRTSQYNTFGDKMNALGNWNGTRSGDNILISNDASKQEGFDVFEIKGYTAPDGTQYPSLFSSTIDWNDGQQNDLFADNNLYGPRLTLAFKNVNINLGALDVRQSVNMNPVNTLDWSKFPADGELTFAETGESSGITALQKTNTPMMGMNTQQPTTTTRSGFSMSLSSSFGLKTNNMQVLLNASQYQMTWSREKYIRQDFQMMKNFGLAAQTQAAILQHQMDPNDQQNTLDQMDGDISFANDQIGGNITMPWNRFYYLYTDSNSWNIVNSLRYMNYTPVASGSRLIKFQYKPGTMQGTVISKSFTIK